MTGEQRLTHVDESGAARMVDVSAKDVTVRSATATACLAPASAWSAAGAAPDRPRW